MSTLGVALLLLQCKKVTHYNFNHDQLAKIFRLVGTPDDSALVCVCVWRESARARE